MTAPRLAAALTATVLVLGLAALGAACLALGVFVAWALPPGWLFVGLWAAGLFGVAGFWRVCYRNAIERQRVKGSA